MVETTLKAEESLSKSDKDQESYKFDIYGLWYRKYIKDRADGGGVFKSKIEDFEVMWYHH